MSKIDWFPYDNSSSPNRWEQLDAAKALSERHGGIVVNLHWAVGHGQYMVFSTEAEVMAELDRHVGDLGYATGRRVSDAYVDLTADGCHESFIRIEPSPVPPERMLQVRISDTECAARAWEAAAAIAGAMAPRHIADALIAGSDLLAAALAGTAAAQAQHEEDVRGGWSGPAPRGVDIAIHGGRATRLTWSSDHHVVALVSLAAGWSLQLWAPDISTSRRVRAALFAAWRLREVADYAEISRAAGEAGLDEGDLERGDTPRPPRKNTNITHARIHGSYGLEDVGYEWYRDSDGAHHPVLRRSRFGAMTAWRVRTNGAWEPSCSMEHGANAGARAEVERYLPSEEHGSAWSSVAIDAEADPSYAPYVDRSVDAIASTGLEISGGDDRAAWYRSEDPSIHDTISAIVTPLGCAVTYAIDDHAETRIYEVRVAADGT